MAIKKIIEVEINDNINVTTDHIDELNKDIKQTEKNVESLNKEFEQTAKQTAEAFKPLKAQYKEALLEVQRMTTQFGETSKEVQQAARRAAELKDRIEDANDAVQAFKGEGLFLATGKAVTSVASGFSAVEGAMGLLGVESEKVQETLLRVNSAMALASGLAGLEDVGRSFALLGTRIGAVATTIKTQLVTAFTTLKGAIIATGIGALVVAIGFLIPKIMEWMDSTEEAKRKQEDLNNSLERQQQRISESRKELQKDLDFRLNYARALGKSENELLKIKEDNNKRTNSLVYKEIEAARERLKALRNANLGVMASSREEYDKVVKDNKDKRIKVVDEIKQLTDEIKRNNESLLIEQTQQNTKEKEVRQQRTKEVKKELQKEQETYEEYLNRRIKMQEDIDAMRLTPKSVDTRQATINKAIKEAEEDMKLRNDKLNAEYEAELKQKERLQQLEEQKNNAKIDAVRNGFSIIGNLAKAFAGQSEEEQKKAFEVQKAANIANAIVDTYASATASYKSLAHIPGVGPVLGGLAAGAAIAAGLANVRAIEQTTFQSTNVSNTNTGGTPTTNATQPQAPRFNIIGGTQQNANVEQKPIQAYVVSGEVTSQQALDRNRLRNATL